MDAEVRAVGLAVGQLPLQTSSWSTTPTNEVLDVHLRYGSLSGSRPAVSIETLRAPSDTATEGDEVLTGNHALALSAFRELYLFRSGRYGHQEPRNHWPERAPDDWLEREHDLAMASSLGMPPWSAHVLQVDDEEVPAWLFRDGTDMIAVADRSNDQFQITAYGIPIPDLRLTNLAIDPSSDGSLPAADR